MDQCWHSKQRGKLGPNKHPTAQSDGILPEISLETVTSSTNANKATVSVLYWYGKLSSLRTEIFGKILKRIKFFFALSVLLMGRCGRSGQPDQTNTPNSAAQDHPNFGGLFPAGGVSLALSLPRFALQARSDRSEEALGSTLGTSILG